MSDNPVDGSAYQVGQQAQYLKRSTSRIFYLRFHSTEAVSSLHISVLLSLHSSDVSPSDLQARTKNVLRDDGRVIGYLRCDTFTKFLLLPLTQPLLSGDFENPSLSPSSRNLKIIAVKGIKAKIRYAAYSSDVGEALRPVVPSWTVKAAYGIVFAYCIGDIGLEVKAEIVCAFAFHI